MQKVILIGHLGKDATVKETSKGKKFLSFTLATNNRFGGVEETTWWDAMAFNYNDGIAPHLKKGSMIQLIGDCRFTNSTDRNGVSYNNKTVVVDSIAFAEGSGSKQQDGNAQPATVAAAEPEQVKAVKPEKFSAAASDDSDLPF